MASLVGQTVSRPSSSERLGGHSLREACEAEDTKSKCIIASESPRACAYALGQ